SHAIAPELLFNGILGRKSGEDGDCLIADRFKLSHLCRLLLPEDIAITFKVSRDHRWSLCLWQLAPTTPGSFAELNATIPVQRIIAAVRGHPAKDAISEPDNTRRAA